MNNLSHRADIDSRVNIEVNERRAGAWWPDYKGDDPDKKHIMELIGNLIHAEHAEWGMLGNGDIEIRFVSGEAFQLGETTVRRIA